MFAGPRTGRRVSIRCKVTRYARGGVCSANRAVLARLYDRAGRADDAQSHFHALFGRVGALAKMQFLIHPHMLRHGCGYALANAGHDTRALQAWLGHKNIQHTVRYTELSPHRFKDFWR
jgi:site-specific recombinase XerD